MAANVFNVTMRDILAMSFLKTYLVLHLSCHVLQLHRLFGELNFYKIFIISNVVELDQRNILATYFMMSCLVSDLRHHFWHHRATFHSFYHFIVSNFDSKLQWLTIAQCAHMAKYWNKFNSFSFPGTKIQRYMNMTDHSLESCL